MKIACFVLLLLALATRQCLAFDSEFGRLAVEDNLDLEEEFRELLLADYEMSMSMSMSMSYSYGYDGNDPDDSGSGGGDSPTDSNGGGDSPTDSNGDGTPPTASNGAGTPSPTSTSSPEPSPTTDAVGPTSAPADDNVSAPPTAAPALPSCLGLPVSSFESPLFIETNRESVRFPVLENALSEAMRELLPFCDPGQRRLEDGSEVDHSETSYYIGNVDLVEGDEGAQCDALLPGNNCFLAELTLRLFGNATQDDVEYILQVVENFLETGVGQALGTENGLIDDVNKNSTESDGGKAGGFQAARGSQGLSAGHKVMISLLTIAVVVLVAGFAYRQINKPVVHLDDEEDDESNPPIKISTEDRDRMYGA